MRLPIIGLAFLLLGAAPQPSRGVGVTLKVGAESISLYSESHALILGASRYTNGWPPLPGVKRDVADVKAALLKQGFDVRTIDDPTRAAMENALRDFVSDFGQQPNARLLIYFAGHGHTLTTSDGRQLGYIVPVEAPLPARGAVGAFKRVAVSMTDIETIALQIESKHVLFVFDSCFSGSIFEVTRAIPDDISERTARPVRQFITAGTAEQTVPDNSLFRAQFVEGIGGEADANRDGYVTGSELGNFLQAKITNYTKRAQTPQYGKLMHSGLDKGDFVFSPGKTVAAAPAYGFHESAIELALWDSIKSEHDPAFFVDYLEKYPNGRFASVARLKARAIGSIVPEPVSSVPAGPAPILLPAGNARFAIVDVQRLLSMSTAGKSAYGRLKRMQEDRIARARSMDEEIQRLTSATEISSRRTALKQYTQQADNEITAARDRELVTLETAIKPVLDAIGRETSLSLLFNKHESGLLYAADVLDISDPVIERFDGNNSRRVDVISQFAVVVDVARVLSQTDHGRRTSASVQRAEAAANSAKEKQEARKAEMAKLYDSVQPAIAQLAAETRFGLAFNKYESGLVYAADAVDVTELLIRKLQDPAYRAATPASRPSRAAVIDVQKVLTQSRLGKAAYEKLKRMQDDRIARAKAMDEEIPRLSNLNEISDRRAAAQRYAKEADQEIAAARDREVAALEASIKPVIDSFGKEMGLAVVFNKFESGLVYAADVVDVTDVIIKRFDQR